MLIKTSNTKLQQVLSGVLMRHPDGDTAFSTANANATILANLATVLYREYPGEWSVKFALVTDLTSYNQLLQVDERVVMFSVRLINAGPEDFIFWLEQIYGYSVTEDNYKRVLQLFRLWHMVTYPTKYREIQVADPKEIQVADPTFTALVHDGDNKRRAMGNKHKQAQRQRRAEVVKAKGWSSEEALLTHLAAHPELIPPPEEKPAGKKWCPMCETWKDYAEFHKDKNRADGLTGRCKACHHKRKVTK